MRKSGIASAKSGMSSTSRRSIERRRPRTAGSAAGTAGPTGRSGRRPSTAGSRPGGVRELARRAGRAPGGPCTCGGGLQQDVDERRVDVLARDEGRHRRDQRHVARRDVAHEIDRAARQHELRQERPAPHVRIGVREAHQPEARREERDPHRARCSPSRRGRPRRPCPASAPRPPRGRRAAASVVGAVAATPLASSRSSPSLRVPLPSPPTAIRLPLSCARLSIVSSPR